MRCSSTRRSGGHDREKARDSGKRLRVGRMPMTAVGRARDAGDTQGFRKVIVDADSQHLLGAALLGMKGDEVIHSLLDVMSAKAPYTTIERAMLIHPAVSELIRTSLGELKLVERSAST